MKNSKFKLQNSRFAGLVLFLIFGFWAANAQSTNQNFPTPITANQISGKIAARDLGDARLTSYFFVFSGTQGDIFINLKTTNLDGDIDIFTADNLRPLTKITVFSDITENETGRVIYLRKPERLILRIEGRTPNDKPATFSLKFAGSFAPAVAEADLPEQPEVKSENQSDVRVNSVGTIIEVKPKPTPKPKEIVAKNESEKQESKKEVEQDIETKPEVTAENKSKKESGKTAENAPKPTVVVTDSVPEKNIAAEKPAAPVASPVKTSPVKNRNPARTRTARSSGKKVADKTTVAPVPNPLDNVRLIILFKDGTKIEKAMSEVLRVGVDKGVLTLISKDGSIGRYSILDVAKMTIE